MSANNFIADADPATTTDPARSDSDGDGIPDGQEDTNHNGMMDPGETDPNPDTDNDNHTDSAEISAKSDLNNPDSKPGTTILTLYKGYNQVSFPAETMYYGDMQNLMAAIGGPAVIEKVLVFDQGAQQFIEAGYAEGLFDGANINLPAGQGLQGMIIYARLNHTVIFTSQYCHKWNLQQGANLVGSGGCIPESLTAQQLLADSELGAANVFSIQRFNPETGEFETRSFDDDGNQQGIDFPIETGVGYLIYMKQAVPDFRP